MARYDFWTHGVSVAVETMDDVTEIVRAGGGTTVFQKAGTRNWYHFAVPTPTLVDDEEKISLKIMAFHGATTNNAVVEVMHAWMGGTKLGEKTVGRTGPGIYDSWPIDSPVYGPLAICLSVYFPQADSSVTFEGAGAGFED